MAKKIDVKNKILLFDLDGTLVDTEKLAERAVEEYCVDNKIFDQAETIKKVRRMIIGRTWKAAVREIIQSHSLSLDPDQCEQDLRARYRKLLLEGIVVVPGLQEKLSEFKAKSLFMGIVTGSAADEVNLILNAEGLASFFERIWSSETYTESKPSPAPFLTAFRDLQSFMRSASGRELQASDVLVFEDSPSGMESAFRAGFSFIQVLHAHPDVDSDPHALFTIQDWRELQIG